MSTFIIAEAGVNHNGSLSAALDLVAEAKAAGADAVKFQAFNPDRLAARGTAQHDLLSWLDLPDECLAEVAERCHKIGIEFMCTPFDEERLEFVLGLGVCRIKISSQSVQHADLLAGVAGARLPVIISNGMCTDAEMAAALITLAQLDRTVLYCVSKYPTPDEAVHLDELRRLRNVFGVPVGFSDHTRGLWASVAAAAAGAVVVEKHITLNRELRGPDHVCSLEPAELRAWVREIRRFTP